MEGPEPSHRSVSLDFSEADRFNFMRILTPDKITLSGKPFQVPLQTR